MHTTIVNPNEVGTVNDAAHTSIQPVAEHGALRAALGLLVAGVLLCGLAYPLIGVGLGQAAFSAQANGSVIEQGGRVVGSALLAQPFVSDGYFQSRPSAAGYDPMAAAGSNLARSNPALREQLAMRQQAASTRYGIAPNAVPSDLVTASGSGLDPDISPEAARIQIARIAQARGMAPAVLEALLQQHTQDKQFGVLGQPRVDRKSVV